MEFEVLREWGVGLEDGEPIVFAEAAARLAERGTMEKLLEAYAPLVKALDPVTAATYFCNRFAAACLSLQYAVSVLGYSIDLSLDRLTVQLLVDGEGKPEMGFKLDGWAEEREPLEEAERRLWLQRVFADFYGNTVRPVYESAAAAAGVRAGQMWGLLPTRFNYMTEQWRLAAPDERVRNRIAADYALLVREVPGAVFGRSKNPFDVTIRWIEHLLDPGKQVRMKNACCHYFGTEGGSYCYTCPRIKEEEREARRIRAREAEAVST